MTNEPNKTSTNRKNTVLRIFLAILVIAAVLAYILAVVLGYIPAGRQIDVVGLGIIVLTIAIASFLVRPDLLDHLRLIEFGGIKFEINQVKEQLNDINMLLPLLLPETEQKHVLNLANGTTANYWGNASLRYELRHLRSMNLIEMVNDHHVGHIEDGLLFNLSDYVRLKESGKYWAGRIKVLEKETAKEYQ